VRHVQSPQADLPDPHSLLSDLMLCLMHASRGGVRYGVYRCSTTPSTVEVEHVLGMIGEDVIDTDALLFDTDALLQRALD
jgi:hypothetical protein